MPIVPTYESSQTTVTPLPRGGFGGDFIGSAAAAGRQMENIGNGIQRAGDAGARIALDMQELANATVAKDIDQMTTQRLNTLLFDPEAGFMAKKGRDVIHAHEDFQRQIEDAGKSALDSIQNPAVQRMAGPVIAARVQHAVDSMNKHTAQESQRYNLQTSESRALVSLQDAAFNYRNEQRFTDALQIARNEAAAQGKLQGWDEDTTKLQAQKYVDNAYRMRYEAWHTTDPIGAFAHFMRSGEQIAPIMRDQIGRELFQRAAPLLAAQVNQTGGTGVVQPAPGEAPLPRGIRNNNPGNLIRGTSPWQGEVNGDDPRYTSFETPEAGIRAMGKTLLAYQDRHGLNTIEGIVGRYAPATENDTTAYVGTVAKALGVKPNAPLDLHDADTLNKLTRAMIRVENGPGASRITDEQITTGLAAALTDSPLKSAAQQAGPRRDPNAQTGLPLIDALPPDWRLHVLQLARSQGHQEMAEAREQLRGKLRDAEAEYMATGFAKNAPSEGEFIRAYGQADGLARYRDLQNTAQLGQTLQQIKTLSSDAIEQLVSSAKPQPGEGFAARQHNFEILVNAAQQVEKSRKADPVEYALTTGAYRIQPIADMRNTAALQQELSARTAAAVQMSKDYGTPLQVMTKGEASAFGDHLASLQAPDKARVLGEVFKATGGAGIQSIATQLKDKHQTVAIAGMLTSFSTTAGNNAALLYLQGKEALEQKRAKIDATAEIGIKAEIYKAIDGVYQTPQGRDAAAEAALGIFAKFKADGGNDVAQAVRIATGGIMTHNGSKIAKPYGWQDGQFRDAMREKVPAALSARGGEYIVGSNRLPAADFAKMLPGARLQTYGQGSYLVMAGSDVVRTASGAPFILTVGN